jgi:hypothetical protein
MHWTLAQFEIEVFSVVYSDSKSSLEYKLTLAL